MTDDKRRERAEKKSDEILKNLTDENFDITQMLTISIYMYISIATLNKIPFSVLEEITQRLKPLYDTLSEDSSEKNSS